MTMSEPNCFIYVCRLCLTESSENIDIFSEDGSKHSVQSKISQFFSFLVLPDEQLPRAICKECLNHLDFFSTFRQKVEKAQEKILSLLPNLAKAGTYQRPLSEFTESNGGNTVSNQFNEWPAELQAFPVSDETDGSNSNQSGYLSNCLKEENMSEDDLDALENGKDCSESDDDNFVTADAVDFIDVNQLDDNCSGNSDEPLQPQNNASCKQVGEGPKRRGRKRKVDKSNKGRESNEDEEYIVKRQSKAREKVSKQPVWTDDMEEEVKSFYQFTCELCTEKLPCSSFSALCKHYRSAHDTEGYLKCCKRKLYCRSHLYQHMILHTRPEIYKCPECEKQLCGPINLKQHLQLFHLPKTALPFRCSVCGRGFATKTAVENHEKSQHFLSDQEKFVHKCDLCGKRFASISGVSEHKKQVHAQIRPLLCEICAKAFPNQSRLRKHMTSHSDSENLKCPHCERRLKNYVRLQVHMKRHQGVIHSCPQCEKTYPTRRLLQRHIKTHSGERPHECSFCGKRYRESSHLKMHLNQHTGAQPFSCLWCPKRFSASGPFYTHRKKVHPEELAKMNDAAAIQNHSDSTKRL